MINSLVSIIMPLFNAEQHVRQAIMSIIAQTYENWELWAIDDCSDDQTWAVISELASQDSRIHILSTDHQSGSPTLPRNIGIEHARGQFIAFLDGDDWWMPNKLEEQIPLFTEPTTKIVFSYYAKLHVGESEPHAVVRSPKRVNYQELLCGNVIGNLTGIYDVSRAGKQFFLSLGHEDYIHWLHILKEGGYAVNTCQVHAVYRLSPSSVSANKLRALVWDWHIYRYVEHLSLWRSCYCFVNYAIKGLIKYFSCDKILDGISG